MINLGIGYVYGLEIIMLVLLILCSIGALVGSFAEKYKIVPRTQKSPNSATNRIKA